MPRTDRLPRALHGRAGAAAAVAAAAAILTGVAAGTASAGTVPHAGTVPNAGTVPHAGTAPAAAGPAAASPLAPAATAAAAQWTPGTAPAPLLTPGPAATAAAAPAAAIPAAQPTAAQHAGVVTAADRHTAAPADRHTAGPAARHTVTAARAAAAGHAARTAAPAKPYLIYDSVTPANIPAHHEIATYADGAYAVPASHLTGKHVLWIDTNGSDPRAGALDVEPGDATPAGAAAWAKAKLTAQPRSTAIIYTMRSDWAAAQAAVDTLPGHMRDQVLWWIADPTGTPHIVPGAQATQWYWGPNYDITTATPGF
jgi:hypothetical protein